MIHELFEMVEKGKGKSKEKKISEYEVEEALSTLLEATKIQKNKKLMALVQTKIEEKKNSMDKVKKKFGLSE